MCHFHNDLPTIEDGEDQYILDTPVMRDFIAAVNAARAAAPNAAAAMEEIRPHFAALLADPHWLPPEYQEPATQSGMGANTGMWLLYRAGDASLAFSALVLAPGRETPVHDHLAWGLVGLYRGEQDEIVYQRRDDARSFRLPLSAHPPDDLAARCRRDARRVCAVSVTRWRSTIRVD
jgi:predicted metal-dependent enzyme (double-stranded beta helix superfamily)